MFSKKFWLRFHFSSLHAVIKSVGSFVRSFVVFLVFIRFKRLALFCHWIVVNNLIALPNNNMQITSVSNNNERHNGFCCVFLSCCRRSFVRSFFFSLCFPLWKMFVLCVVPFSLTVSSVSVRFRVHYLSIVELIFPHKLFLINLPNSGKTFNFILLSTPHCR